MPLHCTNPNCIEYNKEIHSHKLTLKMGDSGLEPKYEIQCETCSEPLKFINEFILPKNINTTFGKFKSSTEGERKRMIKERNALHQDKDDKRRAKEKREMIIKDIKENFDKHKKQNK